MEPTPKTRAKDFPCACGFGKNSTAKADEYRAESPTHNYRWKKSDDLLIEFTAATSSAEHRALPSE
jgi:hypothetical protein